MSGMAKRSCRIPFNRWPRGNESINLQILPILCIVKKGKFPLRLWDRNTSFGAIRNVRVAVLAGKVGPSGKLNFPLTFEWYHNERGPKAGSFLEDLQRSGTVPFKGTRSISTVQYWYCNLVQGCAIRTVEQALGRST